MKRLKLLLGLYSVYRAYKLAKPLVKYVALKAMSALVKRLFGIQAIDDARRVVGQDTWHSWLVKPVMDEMITRREIIHDRASNRISQDELMFEIRSWFELVNVRVPRNVVGEDGFEHVFNDEFNAGQIFDEHVLHHIPHLNTCTAGVARAKLIKQIGVIPDAILPSESKEELRDAILEIPTRWFQPEDFRR